MNRFALAAAVLLFMGAPALSKAQDSYLAVKGDMYNPNEDAIAGSDTNFAAEVAVGRSFFRHLTLEAAIGYFRTVLSALSDLHLSPERADMDIDVFPITVAAKAVLPIGAGALYLGGGAGGYFADAKMTQWSNISFRETDFDEDFAFGYHVVAGGTVDVTEGTFVGLEAKYRWADLNFEGGFFDTPVAKEVKFDGLTAMALVGYRF